ncbi:MAG: aldo/keto reductase [Gammaproteobacteria bacterium]|jgi:diketogulonate reductase-like aldo/keto reductase|nr:aldo/keto reductase [Gammaproteobacteria bacterium]NCW20594.1 aldo/keto reductase [Gammaproteobacteria bacterium]NCW56457.1 aldo/keto reductase [Gammaproteobacteria bacterium]NDA43080.1 aldo/keto reductase [Gammaproteobacteria bacterium]NDB16139.1 aldo/keto reductase [Gammaproteobacteria bacterium]
MISLNRRHFIESSVAAAATAAVATAALPAAAGVALSGEGLIRRRIPSSGEMLPVIGLGTSGPFEVGVDARDREPLAAVLSGFFEGGATVIDTSPMYSSAESVLGELLNPEMQSRAFIATKVWTRGAREGVTQMTRSMELLRRKKVELMQVHNLLDLDVHLPTLRRWKEEGRIRYLGITHYTVESHARLAEIIEREPIDFVQFNYSATTTAAEARLLPLCADKGVAVLVNRAFDDGKIFSRLKDRPLPAWAADIACTSWAQLLLKFVISHPAVTCVIPATGKLRNLQDNLAAGRGPLPDAEQRKAIVAAVA